TTAVGAIAALGCLPGVAAAHTGSVKCDATGVVFSYNANFEQDTFVTENVGQAQRLVVVNQNTASTDTWAGITGTITVSASWPGGGTPEQTRVCPAPPPPVFTTPPPPAAPPAPPAPPAAP